VAPEIPSAALRRRRAEHALLLLLAAFTAARLGTGLRRAFAPGRVPPPPPLVVDLARDPAWRLALLPGIGPRHARAIVEDRRRRGPAREAADLLRVGGLGPATLARALAAVEVRVRVEGRVATMPP
jgi:hypothetical protein